ncbi:MAG: hypothetical protein M1834_006807 [Cirrosporium novae-zelandiae]|nr:MAG: hypothetical protein M1834_006807 [Cirrosporium novae-zelandiae]
MRDTGQIVFKSLPFRVTYACCQALCQLIVPAVAMPVQSRRSTVTENEDDRDSPFQVLADGTQDLAALVGIFATNSVERFSIDYSRDSLSAAVSLLSLLGLLGYARALVKLGLGPVACEHAGFDTKSLRSLFGVPDSDRLPEDELFSITYFDQNRRQGSIIWTPIRTLRHTVDSSPRSLVLRDGRAVNFRVSFRRLTAVRAFRNNFIIGRLVSIGCIGATCFSILPFSGPSNQYTWTTYCATIGLFMALSYGSSLWAWVHTQEAVSRPSAPSEFAAKKGSFAISCKGMDHQIYNSCAITGPTYQFVRFSSLFVSAICILGYICQYIELRRTTAGQAGIWLAIQGAFAFVRICVWLFYPHHFRWAGDRINHYEEFSTHQRSNSMNKTIGTRRVLPAMTVHVLLALWWTQVQRYDAHGQFIAIPEWITFILEETRTIPIWDSFNTIKKKQHRYIDIDATLNARSALKYWDMPPSLFEAWLLASKDVSFASDRELEDPTSGKLRPHGSVWPGYWACRVISMNENDPTNGPVQFLPGIVAGMQLWGTLPGSDVRYYFGSANAFFLAFYKDDPVNWVYTFLNPDASLPQQWIIGRDTPIPHKIIRQLAAKTTFSGNQKMGRIIDALSTHGDKLNITIWNDWNDPQPPPANPTPFSLDDPGWDQATCEYFADNFDKSFKRMWGIIDHWIYLKELSEKEPTSGDGAYWY